MKRIQVWFYLLLAVVSVAIMTYSTAQTGCDSTNTPPTDPNGHAWAPNQQIAVNIDPAFDSGQQAALQQAFTNW
ncbi:MAG TPA: hypothetical protein VH593_09970, partial [Ktedonobacteraceae bacterium]